MEDIVNLQLSSASPRLDLTSAPVGGSGVPILIKMNHFAPEIPSSAGGSTENETFKRKRASKD